jgi:hypothetical protein
MASRSCLTTVGVCCLVHQELWKQDLRTTRYPLPSLTQLLEKFWVGSEALRLGSLSCLQLWVLTARLTKAPSASSVNHMFPFLLSPKCNGLLYGIWKLLDQQVQQSPSVLLQMCRIQAVLHLNYPNISVNISRLGICGAHTSVRSCLFHRLHISLHIWLVWVQKEKEAFKCQQHRNRRLTLSSPDLTKCETTTWALKTTANFLVSLWC